MKGRVVILDEVQGRAAAALMVDGRLSDLLIDPAAEIAAPGALYRAQVGRQMKGQGGVFLDLPGGARAFLRQARGLKPGQTLLVQVTGFAEPGKAVPVTTKILFKSRYAIVTPDAPGRNVSRSIKDDEERDRLLELAHEGVDGAQERFGLILRSACAGVGSDAVAEDIAAMRALAEAVSADAEGAPELLVDAPDAHMLAWRDWADPVPDAVIEGGFADHGVLDEIDALWGGVALSGGGSVWVEPTRALVAIDVNTGTDTSPAAGLKANIAAAREVPRLLRLRGLGGQVTVDFAPMPIKDRRQVEQTFKAAFRADPVDTTLAGWTNLGNFELQRKRERLPLERGITG